MDHLFIQLFNLILQLSICVEAPFCLIISMCSHPVNFSN